MVRISSALDSQQELNLVTFLCDNIDVFTWESTDMHGIPREVAKHCLNVNLVIKQVKQKLHLHGKKTEGD